MENSPKKKSLIGKILKWTGISFLVLIVLIIALPFLFKDKIIQMVKDEANNNLNAKVDFGEFDLTLISSFPDFRFSIQKLSVVGVNEFEKDTLASIGKLDLDLNLMSVIKGEEYNIKKIVLEKPIIHGIVMSDGKANWDIAKPSADTVKKEESSEPFKFKLKLKKFNISDAWITFDDMKSNMKAEIVDWDFNLAGDFTQDNFLMEILSEIKELSFSMGGVGYANKLHLGLKLNMEMDMPNAKYTFKENEINLNELGLGIDGFVAMPGEDINMDVKFLAKQTEFKSILSLIPAVYSKDFASVQTKGKLALNGNVKGTYNDKTMPAFGVHLEIADAMFKYPSLPKSVNNINVKIDVENPNGNPDATAIDVQKFHVEMAGNPVDMAMQVRTPVSDPALKGWVKGIINLASVKEFIPQEAGDAMTGTVKADIKMAGKLSSIEKEKYEEFEANGSLAIDQINYKTASLPYEVFINTMLLNFSPQYVELAGFDCKMGNTDIQASGKIENFLQFIFKDSLITGHFNMNSKLIDLNQLMSSSSSESTNAPATADTAAMAVIEVPANIDFIMNANIASLNYSNYDIKNVVGNIEVKDARLNMSNLKMNILDGSMIMNGFYETKNPKKPAILFNLDLNDFDFQRTFKTFNTVQKLAPIGQYAKGLFSASIKNLVANLNDKMEPELNSLTGNGTLKTKSAKIEGFDAFQKLADALKINQLKNMEFQNMDLSYEFKDGRVSVKPVKTKIADIPLEISGSTGFDQTIDYKWAMQVPTKLMGQQAAGVVNNLLGQVNQYGTNLAMPEKVDVDVFFGGTVEKPTVRTGMKGAQASLKDQANAIIEEKKQEIINEVKNTAAQEAEKLLADAQKQADQIKADAAREAEKLKAEGYKQADDLQNKGGNPLEKIANKKLAENLRKQTDKQVDNLLKEANTRADKVVADAHVEADKLKAGGK